MDDQRARLDERRTACRARFARLVARPEPEIDLAPGALLLAEQGRGPVDEEAMLAGIDAIAELVRFRLDTGASMPPTVARVDYALYLELTFRGPTAAEV